MRRFMLSSQRIAGAIIACCALLGLQATGCECEPAPLADAGPLGDGFQSLVAVDESTLRLSTSRALDASSVSASAFSLHDYTSVPPLPVDILSATLEEDVNVVLATGPLVGGRTYTLELDLQDTAGNPISGTLNVVAVGDGILVPVEVVVSNPSVASEYDSLVAMVTVDLETGAFSESLTSIEMTREGAGPIARFEVRVDANRTLQTSDDDDPNVDRRAYGIRIVDDRGRVASPLVRFALPTPDAPRTIAVDLVRPPQVVTEPDVPPPTPEVLPESPEDVAPDDGLKVVRIVVDDRAAGELNAPALRMAFDEGGAFDATFPRTEALSPMDGDFEGFWEVVVEIAVDPARVADGQTNETFPYFAYLVEDGTEYEGLSVGLLAPDEVPEVAILPLGNPDWTPVTFRVDVGGAFLVPDGSEKGHFDGEAIFLTGEWLTAVDALGNNCGDAFSGGEQPCLKMREHPGRAGVWTRTIWLPPGRPYGWKVVRCDATVGCGPLNQIVASSGRAFATVMKNLVTDNVDAFSDANVGLADPLDLENTAAGDASFDYSLASVYVGNGEGSEPDPAGTPDGERLFKQEVPDLVVVVAEAPIVTRVFHVGTWRDVNLGRTPAEVIADGETLELTAFDYDDGFIGRYPPSRAEP